MSLRDGDELSAGTDPTQNDSDSDRVEDNDDLNPTSSIDSDGDGMADDWGGEPFW